MLCIESVKCLIVVNHSFSFVPVQKTSTHYMVVLTQYVYTRMTTI